jgi:hypothetical protein
MPVPDFCIHESEGGIMGKSTAAVNESLWMPASLLQDDSQQKLANALFAASRYNEIERHFNKGLAGAPAEAIEAAKGTAMNPAVQDAFALAIGCRRPRPRVSRYSQS